MPADEPPHTAALFVRLPIEQARRLDLAATALSARKKDLVTGLVERYVHPESPEGLDALRGLATVSPSPRRVTIDLEQPADTVGHHSFHPAAPAEVLSAAQAAELLTVPEEALLELAERRKLPGRQIAGEWRFSRTALLNWLGETEAEDAAPS